MKINADEGTYFSDVQTSSLKQHLAKDANDNKLHNSALMEMIGHLSNEKQETTREIFNIPLWFCFIYQSLFKIQT